MGQELKAGDKVKLKSGGPLMVIAELGNYSMTGSTDMKARCTWFDAKDKLEENVFELHILEKS